MKSLEDLIKDNANLFNSEEPSEGHFYRFSTKLELRAGRNTAKRNIVPYLLKAAVVTLLVTLSSFWTWDHFIRPDRNKMSLGDVSQEFREVENYYVHQVNLMQNEIVSLSFENNPEQKDILRKEIQSMDSVYVQLQKELKANPYDERIINAMIKHYQTKLDVMNYIIDQLITIRNESNKTTENGQTNI